MKRFLTMALVGVVALGFASTASANLCATDVVPAATLLFPFVTYDYDAGVLGNDGQTTLFAITNVSSEAQIVHITIWTDFSVAILDFNLTLTGYDVQTINIRDILRDGKLPYEGLEGGYANIWEPLNAGGSPFDDGPYSTFNELWDGNLDAYFAANGLFDPQSTAPALNCDPLVWDSSPNHYAAAGAIPSGTLTLFEGYLNRSQDANKWYEDCDGDPIEFDNDPWFLTRDSGPTWMYITADVVGACNKELPDTSTLYWSDAPWPGWTIPAGVLSNNVLIGDILYLDSGNNFSESDNAVHIEAAPGFGTTQHPDSIDGKGVTFYHRYHDGLGGAFSDGREPLPTAWAFRYIVAPTAGAKTWIRAWKGGTIYRRVQDLNDGVISGQNPADLYANSCIPYTYYAWDEDENVNAAGPGFVPPWSGGPTTEPIPVPNLLPLETQEVDAEEFFLVGDPQAGAFGWMLFIWPWSNYDGTNPSTTDYDMYQTWMGVKYASFGQYTSGLSAAVMGNYACRGDRLPILGLGRYSE